MNGQWSRYERRRNRSQYTVAPFSESQTLTVSTEAHQDKIVAVRPPHTNGSITVNSFILCALEK